MLPLSPVSIVGTTTKRTAAVATENLKTLPQLAREWGVTERRAGYAARVYQVPETQRVGAVRLFNSDDAARLKSAIVRVASNRGANA
jgi:hypothetical protein